MGETTDGGTEDNGDEWEHFYDTMTAYMYRDADSHHYYLIGHNTDKRWFIQQVTHNGYMYYTKDNGYWDTYWDYLFPIDYDAQSYAKVDNWMEHLNDVIGDRKLREIALPGSHDAGMTTEDYDRNHCHLADDCRTITQTSTIRDQLGYGSRFFDIRPVIIKDQPGDSWLGAGHVAESGGSTIGCWSESSYNIKEDLNDFFADDSHQNELVILKISHCSTQPNWDNYAECTNSQVKEMTLDLAGSLDEHLIKCNDDCKITDMTLNQLLALGNIIIVAPSVARDRAKGIFSWGYGSGCDYYLYDNYSNTTDFEKMKDDQIKKLLEPDNHKYPYDGFLFSWTLTLQLLDEILCEKSILDYAAEAQPKIFEFLYDLVEEGKLTKTLFPNILYVDAVWRTQTNAAIYLNNIYDTLPD
jgi:hypothetical protein